MITLDQAVKSSGLFKVYHSKETIEAFRGVNISVDKDELFTPLGPNSAEKTTFLCIISTQLIKKPRIYFYMQRSLQSILDLICCSRLEEET